MTTNIATPSGHGQDVANSATPDAGTEADRAHVAEGEQAFAARLYAQLPHGQNVFFSPTSIRMALAMTYGGAKGDTAKEMERALLLSGSSSTIHDGFSAELRDLDAGKSVHVVNRLWAQKGRAFLPDYLALLQRDYGAPVTQLDFRTDTENSRKTINAFIEDNTAHKIQDLIPEGVLTTGTKLVLTNAVYFKGTWQTAFDPKATKDAPFFVTSSTSTPTKLMEMTHELRYASTSDAHILELPYSSGGLSMVVVLPKDRDGISKIDGQLNDASIASWTRGLAETSVAVSLPRFTMTRDLKLRDPLGAMGMTKAFGDADFSGMDGTKELSIGDVLHKAFVAVDEQGTEAAAATAVVVRAASAVARREEPVAFRADHPFVFFIRDAKGSVVFMGRVNNPTG